MATNSANFRSFKENWKVVVDETKTSSTGTYKEEQKEQA